MYMITLDTGITLHKPRQDEHRKNFFFKSSLHGFVFCKQNICKQKVIKLEKLFPLVPEDTN